MIYYLAGDNQFLIKKRYLELTEPLIKRFGSLALEKLDSEEKEPNSIIEAIKSPPFLIPQKAVIIFNVCNKDLIEQIIATELPENVLIIVLITKLDKRAVYYKKLSKLKQFELHEQKNTPNISNWIINYVKEAGGSLNLNNANYLIERVGQNQTRLSNELDKLVLFNPEITKQTIKLLTVPKPQSTTFQLLEAAFNGQTKQVQKIYQDLRAQKIEPQLIIGLIAWQLHLLTLVKHAGNKSSQEISTESGISSFAISKTQKLASKIPYQELKNLIEDACKLDYNLKTTNLEADNLILLYLASIKLTKR